MNPKTKIRITNLARTILDKVMLQYEPNLNTYKIADFYTSFLEIILGITSGIVLILTFVWYLPTMYGLSQDKITIILLCVLIITIRMKKNE